MRAHLRHILLASLAIFLFFGCKNGGMNPNEKTDKLASSILQEFKPGQNNSQKFRESLMSSLKGSWPNHDALVKSVVSGMKLKRDGKISSEDELYWKAFWDCIHIEEGIIEKSMQMRKAEKIARDNIAQHLGKEVHINKVHLKFNLTLSRFYAASAIPYPDPIKQPVDALEYIYDTSGFVSEACDKQVWGACEHISEYWIPTITKVLALLSKGIDENSVIPKDGENALIDILSITRKASFALVAPCSISGWHKYFCHSKEKIDSLNETIVLLKSKIAKIRQNNDEKLINAEIAKTDSELRQLDLEIAAGRASLQAEIDRTIDQSDARRSALKNRADLELIQTFTKIGKAASSFDYTPTQVEPEKFIQPIKRKNDNTDIGSGSISTSCGVAPVPPVNYVLGRCVNGKWEFVSKSSMLSITSCGTKPTPRPGCKIGRCVDGAWEQECKGDSKLVCGLKPLPEPGCVIGRCVNGAWEQVCRPF